MRQPFHMTRGLRVVSTIITTLLRLGLPVGPAVLLSVRGRTSGKIYTIPITLVENSGTSFLVAAFGEVNWVRNLRAAGQVHLTRRRRTEAIGVVELGAREAAPILKQFLRESQRVSFIKPYFRVTPHSSLADFEQEALYHPVFRIVSKKGAYLMSTEDNKALVRRFYGEGVHNPALFDELLTPTYVLHFPGSPPIAGIEQAKQLMVAYTSAFPDLQLTTEDVVAEGDKVAIRNTWRGTHQVAFQGLPPTGKHVTFSGSDFFRCVGGKIAEQWADLDALGLMQQLGGIPAMG
ncbi:MAG TPA: nitroreductase/quinone reductase family protein, partial [Candidatus Bathyarchaeia archaeon]|nr:nitroreductase/quinone reductase family protein [Candidatus Bathyarchaeia archaeon]